MPNPYMTDTDLPVSDIFLRRLFQMLKLTPRSNHWALMCVTVALIPYAANQLSIRTGLYAESHGIVANVREKREYARFCG